MRIHLKRIGLIFCCMTALICVFALGANAYTYPTMPSDWENVQVTVGSVTMPLDRYPSGSYFDPEKSTMTVEEQVDYGFNLGRPLDLRGWECVGFARYVYSALFYKFPQNATIDLSLAYSAGSSYAYINMIEEVLGTKTLAAGYSASTLKTLFTSCRPGAVMRCGGHSMVLMAIFDDGCLIYDANFSSNNEVSVRKYTWQSFVSSFGGKEMTALQMPTYYPGYSYSSGGSQSGYDIDTSTAGNYEVYNCSTLNVRSIPSTSGAIVGTLQTGDQVKVLGTYNDWAKIDYGGVGRWVHTDYLKPVSTSVTVTFDANGGTASVTSKTYTAGSTFGTMPTATKADRTLLGWYDGNTQYTDSSTVPAVSTLILKAQWCILEFRDVVEGAWYSPYIEDACKKGLISRDDHFRPDDNASRGEMVTVLGREYERETGTKITNSGSSKFVDVPADMYYATYVTWGAELGIVQGMTSDTFEPSRNVTREQIAVFLFRFAVYRGMTVEGLADTSSLNSFDDCGLVSDYSKEAMSWAVEVGIIRGDDQNCLNPRNNARRSEMVTMFSRYIDYITNNNGVNAMTAEAAEVKPGTPDSPDEPETSDEVPEAAETLTRSAAAVMLGGLYEEQTDTVLPQPEEMLFDDVDAAAEDARYIAWAVDAEIMTGTSEREFGPEDQVTRQELALYLYRLACQTELITDEDLAPADLTAYTDGDQVPEDFQKAVSWALDCGLLAADEEGQLLPEEAVDLETAETVLEGYLELIQVRDETPAEAA